MTVEDFKNLKFGAGMRISHTCTIAKSSRLYDVISVNFAEHTFGVKDGETIECTHCGEDTEILTWLSCENCEFELIK